MKRTNTRKDAKRRIGSSPGGLLADILVLVKNTDGIDDHLGSRVLALATGAMIGRIAKDDAKAGCGLLMEAFAIIANHVAEVCPEAGALRRAMARAERSEDTDYDAP
jgi:hypothetical protein